MVRRIPRWLARAPIPLYRHGLGWLLGPRLVMLEHVGRKTGRRRLVVLEVVQREPGKITVVSGYGPMSQWFRNIEAEPEVRVWSGRIRGAAASARVLGDAEARERLERYRGQHPRAAAALGRTLGLSDLHGAKDLPLDVARRLPIVELTPRHHEH